MYFDEFIQKLRQTALPAIVLLYGDSAGVISEGYQQLRKTFRQKAPDGTVNIFEGGEADLNGFLSSAQTASLFASRQLLVFRNAEKVLGGKSDTAQARLSEYLGDPNPDTVLFFSANGLRKTSKIVSLIEKKGWAVQCSDIPDWKLTPWLRQQAKSMDLDLSEEAGQALIQKAGSDIAYLNRALEHLSLFIYPEKKPSLPDVLNLSIPGTEAEIFPFLDAMGSRRTEKTIQSLRDMPPSSENGLVFMMYQRIRDLLSVSAGKAEGLGQSDLAQRMVIHPFRVKNLWEQSGQFTQLELRAALNDLIRIQAGLVTGRVGKNALTAILEWWVVKWGKNPLAAGAVNGR